MEKVFVNTGSPYDVLIAPDLLHRTGKLVAQHITPCTVAVVTDDIVDPLYSDTVIKSLTSCGFEVVKHVFPNGEENKTLKTFGAILDFLAENRLTRSDIVLALGGGVCGDMAGFAAACFLRGIRFVQMPTTLLAAVDSSVGGKTAIDLPMGKNLVGAFHQPSLVICDTNTLDTLSDDIISDGVAEAIKSGIIGDVELFSMFEDNTDYDMREIIKRCVHFKANIVTADEKEKGERMKLNLGHTFGHAIEQLSHFEISHGKCVAIGMAIMARAATGHGMCSEACAERIIAVLQKHNLPISCAYSAHEIVDVALSDKKRSGGQISIIIPQDIGQCGIYKTDVEKLYDFILPGLV